jgi:iron complex outermembrane receptor protein
MKFMQKKKLMFKHKFVAVSVVFACFPICINAQETEEKEESLIEVIQVNARKKVESIQDTPLAVSAFTGEGLRDRALGDISQIDQIVPNMTFDSTAPISGSSNAASVFIRGIGQSDFALTADPGVGIYLDGVYIARSTGSVFDSMDIERIEVVRGPQGTLFGKNTIGGAISVTTTKPDEIFRGGIETMYRSLKICLLDYLSRQMKKMAMQNAFLQDNHLEAKTNMRRALLLDGMQQTHLHLTSPLIIVAPTKNHQHPL